MSQTLTLWLLCALATPFVVGLLLMLCRNRREAVQSAISLGGAVFWLLFCTLTLVTWWKAGGGVSELSLGNLYENGTFHFPLLFLVDRTSLTFLVTSAALGMLIVKYCRYYLHREEGYARFFITIFFFLGGMGIISCADTFEVLFAGWEIVGAASFLLIGFYRDRPTAQRNALRAFVVYRICDVGLLLGAWLGHLVWHENKSFMQLAATSPEAILSLGTFSLVGISFLVLLAASGKSALFPFSPWLPRAMEGPTPSSAIFYGALSVHAGVLLLLRTAPLWSALPVTGLMVGGLGAITALTASLSGRVQSNIKSQVGYASIAQIGLMLVELSLGLYDFVLFHFVANAMLRCYQLLVSPSVVAHLLRVQAASAEEGRVSDWSFERRWIPRSLRTSVYTLAMNEGYLDHLSRVLVWNPANPLKWIAKGIESTKAYGLVLGSALLGGSGLVLWWNGPTQNLEVCFTVAMLVSALSALSERKSPSRAWNAIALGSVSACLAVVATGDHAGYDAFVHLSGIGPSWLVGSIALYRLTRNRQCDLRWHYGMAQVDPVSSFIFLIAVLGISGFPITPAFVGEDLLLHHALFGHLWLAFAITIGFVINGIVAMRLYTRICLGPWRRTLPDEQMAAA